MPSGLGVTMSDNDTGFMHRSRTCRRAAPGLNSARPPAVWELWFAVKPARDPRSIQDAAASSLRVRIDIVVARPQPVLFKFR